MVPPTTTKKKRKKKVKQSVFESNPIASNADASINSTYGYHKPIMIAGGIGYINNKYTKKNKLRDGDMIAILGGPSFRIGIGGGAASAMQSGSSSEELDFASVQRDNAEIERRCIKF